MRVDGIGPGRGHDDTIQNGTGCNLAKKFGETKCVRRRACVADWRELA